MNTFKIVLVAVFLIITVSIIDGCFSLMSIPDDFSVIIGLGGLILLVLGWRLVYIKIIKKIKL